MTDNLIVFEGKSEYQRVNLENRLIDFALSINSICSQLPKNNIGNYLTDQLVRASGSVAFNYGEAQSGESRKDFIHKMKICLKELRECMIGLKFIKRGGFLKNDDSFESLHKENNELISIFVKSIQTAKKNLL